MSVLKRNDRHDTDHVEAKLISIGHHLVRFARLKRLNVSERTLLWEAAEIVWNAKREYRAELKVRRAVRASTVAARFKKTEVVA
jgi:predicted metal-dependent hydrolase